MKSWLKFPKYLYDRINLFLDKDYVNKKLKKRKGKCNKCGKCCLNCYFLDKKRKICKVYHNRPLYCYTEFPIDRFDQEIWGVEKKCGYKFN